MGTILRLTAAAGLAVAATGLLSGPAEAAQPTRTAEGAVFVQNDNTAGNAIVAYHRGADGSLRGAGTYPTGGKGGVLTGSVVDHLASQGALAHDRRAGLLYAVNAGSDTVSVFAVDGDRLTRRQVVASGGTFPVSVAVHGDVVYVLNARGGGSVQGYRRVGRTLLRIPGWHRALGLDPAATPEFTHTPGQVAFTPDGTKLIVTTKAGSNAVDVFAVDEHGGLSSTPVVNVEPGTVPFAADFDTDGHLVLAEAGPNAVATFAVHRDGTLSQIDAKPTGQTATCWIVGTDGRFYLSNAASGTLSGYRDSGSGALTALGDTGTDPGTVDAAVSRDGRYLYVQAGKAGDVDSYRIGADGSLHRIGAVTVPGAAGGQGIVAS